MKIRIKGNSLRYRLSKTDVSTFTKSGYLEEKTTFGSNQLIYAVEKTHDNALFATFSENKITLWMPVKMADEWASTDRIGFEGHDGELFILIEKDFQCLDNVIEDQSDNYPNPKTC